MRRGRVLALSLLLLAGFSSWFYAHVRSGNHVRAHRALPVHAVDTSDRPAIAAAAAITSTVTASPAAAEVPPSQSFNQRLRCTQTEFFVRGKLPRKELLLLCQRKPLEVLQIEAPLARAGDRHAIDVVGVIASFGRCDLLTPGPDFRNHHARMIEIVRRNGAAPQTLQRLDDLLAEEERGPTAEELEACGQAAELLRALQPGAIQELTGVLGRSVQALRGENDLDVEIEYSRKTLMPGDAEGEEHLARLLLQKETADSQAEALALLEQVAATSPSAKATLAGCMLRGCPTPDADRSAARKLLTDAGAAGDLVALTALAGPASPDGFDSYPDLPAPERYAWGLFLERLQEEGCFGSANYASWALVRPQRPGLSAMSPADATAAQARAAELLGKQLGNTRALLSCD